MRNTMRAAFASVSLIAMAAPAVAEEAKPVDATTADGAAADEANVIVVEARRRAERAQDVPLVVNVVNSENLGKLNIRDGTEVQTLVPGLQLRNEANGIGGAGQLRGIQFDVNTSAGPTVAFYLNDAPIDGGSVLQSVYDIGQVEVLRGPQGTLRGTATPSGSITFTTKKPVLGEVGVVGQSTVTSTGTKNLNGAFNLPIFRDVFAIRLAGLYEDNEANRVRSIDSDRDLQKPYGETRSLRVSGLFKPADWLKMEGMYQVITRESRFYPQYASFSQVSATAPASPTLITPRDRLSILETANTTNQRFEVFNWRTEARLAGQVLIYQGSQSLLRFKSVSNSDAANFLNARDYFQTTNTRSKQTSHEVRLQNEDKVFGLLDYVVGYYDTKARSPSNLTVETPIMLPSFLGGGVAVINQTPISTDGDTKERAVFGNLTLHVDDATQISGGLRYLNIKSPARNITIGTTARPVGPALNDKKVVYTASIQHKFTPDIMVYASTGSSFRSGPSIVNPGIIVPSPRINSYLALRGEESTSYEVGLKSSWLDNRLLLNLTAYHQKFKNFPYKISTPVFYQGFDFINNALVPKVDNGAQFGASVPVTVNGFEAEVSYKLSDNFSLGVSAAYADGKIKNGTIPCNDLNGDGVPDVTTTAPTLAQVQAAYGSNFIGACSVTQRSSLQSPFSAIVQGEYNHPVSNKVNAFARGLFTFNGASQVEPTNTFDDLGSYGLLNLFLGLRDKSGAWELTVYGKNVTNTVRATRFDPPATSGYQELAPPTFRTTVGKTFTSTYSPINTTAPREFGISLRFAFGSR